MPWFVYLLRCADGTLYTGVTTDVERRLREHNAGGRLAARYTRSRRPVELVHQEPAADKAEAYRREAAIKKLKRTAKLAALRPSPIGGEGARPAMPTSRKVAKEPLIYSEHTPLPLQGGGREGDGFEVLANNHGVA